MPINRTVYYFAKQAYQFALRRGIYTIKYCGGKVECEVDMDNEVVWVAWGLDIECVPIAKSWAKL